MELKSTVLRVRDLSTEIEAALVERFIPSTCPVSVTRICSGITADTTIATVGVRVPFASSVETTIDGVTVLRAEIVLARRNSVLNLEVVERRAKNNVGRRELAIVATIRSIRFMTFSFTTVEVGAVVRVDTNTNFTEGTEDHEQGNISNDGLKPMHKACTQQTRNAGETVCGENDAHLSKPRSPPALKRCARLGADVSHFQ